MARPQDTQVGFLSGSPARLRSSSAWTPWLWVIQPLGYGDVGLEGGLSEVLTQTLGTGAGGVCSPSSAPPSPSWSAAAVAQLGPLD